MFKKVLAHIFTIFNFGSDIAIGVIALSLLSNLFDYELTKQAILIALLFSLLPDIDMLIELPLRLIGKASHNEIHQVYTHFPIIYIPLAFIIFVLNPFYGLLFTLNIILHFIHDSVGTGWGIAWLWPFDKSYYKFFSDEEGKFSRKTIQKWSIIERKNAIYNFGDRYWMENLYINSWFMKRFSYIENVGPQQTWLKNYHGNLRFFFYAEILITIMGIYTILNFLK